MKKWIVEHLLDCKCLRVTFYEVIFERYLKSIKDKNRQLKKELEELEEIHRTVLSQLEREIKSRTELIKSFPMFNSFEQLAEMFIKLAEVIKPLLPEKKKSTKKKK